jgi:hypothetical protein
MHQRVPCGPYGSAGYPHLSQPTKHNIELVPAATGPTRRTTTFCSLITSPEGLQRITANKRERPRCQDAGLMGPARRRCYCAVTTGSKRHARGNPRPPTRVAVATCRRMVFTQAVLRTWHQRGRTGFGISGSGSRGRYRTARRKRLFVFRMGPSSNKGCYRRRPQSTPLRYAPGGTPTNS